MKLVLNASPIICLAKAGLLQKVLGLAREVYIPGPVGAEIQAVADASDAAAGWLKTADGLQLLCEVKAASPFILAWDLGAGESSVLALASVLPGSVAVLDDLSARRCANALGVDVVGTLGLLLKAKKAGIISSLRQALDAVTDAGLFVSRKHIAAILDAGGEGET